MPGKHPNVLVLFTDDQRFDTIAALGNDRIITPNLDRLVERGTAFTQAHIPSGMVGAVCMPSRAMLHTGRSLYHLGGAGESIPSEFTLLGEAFGAAGYATFGTGKWHNGTHAFNRSFGSGGEIMFGGMADHWNVPMCDYDPSGSYDNLRPVTPDWFHSNRTVDRNVDHISPGAHSTELITEETLGFLDGVDADSPFFAYAAFLAPHDPRTMPRRFLELYDPDAIEIPASFAPEHVFDYGIRDVRDELLEAYPRSEAAIRRHIAEYYAMITHVDDAIGRIVAKLEERAILDETIIVFAGDNGLALGRHGLMGKQNAYEHSVRVPLVFAGPGVPPGRRSDAFVYLFDVFPTLCGLTGLPVPASVEGIGLVPAIERPDTVVRDELYFGYADLVRAAKTRTHKLICYVQPEPRVQLFDLEHDADERNDLSGNPGAAQTLRRMYAELLRLRDAWDDRQTEWGRSFWRRFQAAVQSLPIE